MGEEAFFKEELFSNLWHFVDRLWHGGLDVVVFEEGLPHLSGEVLQISLEFIGRFFDMFGRLGLERVIVFDLLLFFVW